MMVLLQAIPTASLFRWEFLAGSDRLRCLGLQVVAKTHANFPVDFGHTFS